MTWLFKRIVFLSVLMIVALTYAKDVCDSQCTCLEYELEDLIVNCRINKNEPDVNFDVFEWPKTENRTIKAFFNNRSIHLLPKISGDSKVVSLNFDDNLIRTLPSNPFEYFTNLESISIANNFITDLTKDFLKSTIGLRTLILSNNSLSKIDANIFAHLKQLNEIDLSSNEITKLSADLIEALSGVKIFKIARNQIFTIDNAHNGNEYQFEQMFLSHNQLSVVTGSMFEKFTKLQSIDLSNNLITNVDENSFTPLQSLKFLDLSDNKIRKAHIRLPNTLELMSMANNKLVTWPFANVPENLQELEIQHNSLEIIFPKNSEVDSLRTLDVSYNLIDRLPNTRFLKLDTLDLGYNQLQSVPQNLNSMSPLLRTLVLDGNQITSVFFPERTSLESISLSYMPTLEVLEAKALSNIAGTKISREGTKCLDVYVSHNENLQDIDESALEGVNLCYLDLSYNNLTKVPQNLTDWDAVLEGFDLQGNPWACECEDQWMMKTILDKLMKEGEHQYLLLNLRCNTPEEMKDSKFVKFHERNEPLCGDITEKKLARMVDRASFGITSLDANDNDKADVKLELAHGPGFFIIVGMCSLILILMVVVGLKWQRDQDRKRAMRNRLYNYDY